MAYRVAIVDDSNIVTSVCCGFLRWTLAFGEMLGIKVSPKTFGI